MGLYIQNQRKEYYQGTRGWTSNIVDGFFYCIDDNAFIALQDNVSPGVDFSDCRLVYDEEINLPWGQSWHELNGHVIRKDPVYGGFTARKQEYDKGHLELKR